MTRFMNVIASLALTTAFAPIAANAAPKNSLDHVYIATQKANSDPLPEMQLVSARNAATARQTTNDVVVSSGDWWSNQRYPVSFGG